MLPVASFAVHVIAVLPIGNADGELLDIATCSTSVAVALPSDTALSVSEVASTLMSLGEVIFGAVVSTTSTRSEERRVGTASSSAVYVIVVIANGKDFGAS